MLAEARKFPDADSLVLLDRIRAQAKDLRKEDNKDSEAKRMGQIQAKQEIIQELDFIRERLIRNPGLTTLRDSSSEIETRHEQRLRAIETSTRQ